MDVAGSGHGLISGICLEKERDIYIYIVKIRIMPSKLEEKMKQTKRM